MMAPPVGIASVVRRAWDSGGWYALEVPAHRVAEAFQEATDEGCFLAEEEDLDPDIVIQSWAGVPRDLAQRLQIHPHFRLIVARIDDQDAPSPWESLNLERARLVDGPPMILVGSRQVLVGLKAIAPDLKDWIRFLQPDLSVGLLDVEQRLESLRKGTGLTDAQVMQMADQGTIPLDPVFGEWLALLGRGDDLGR